MLFTTGAGYILFVTDSQFKLQDTAKTALQRDTQRTNELAVVDASKLDNGNLGVSVTNVGNEPIQVKQILIIDYKSSVLKNMSSPSVPITLNVQTKTASPIDTSVIIQQGANYTLRVVTDRGSLFSTVYPPAPSTNFTSFVTAAVSSEVAKSIGSLMIGGNSLRFFYADSYSLGDGYPINGGYPANGYFGYAVPATTKMVFKIQVTNLDTKQRSINLNQKSLLQLTLGAVQSSSYVYYIIKNVTDSSPYTNGISMQAFTTITIPYDQTRTILFGASSPGGTNTVNGLSSGTPVGVFLILFGEYDDTTYFSQTIPFQAAYVNGATINSATTSGCQGSTYTANLQSNTWSSGPHAYFVTTGDNSTDITSGTPTTSQVQYRIPSGIPSGYYQIFFNDNLNQAYLTFQVTC